MLLGMGTSHMVLWDKGWDRQPVRQGLGLPGGTHGFRCDIFLSSTAIMKEQSSGLHRNLQFAFYSLSPWNLHP